MTGTFHSKPNGGGPRPARTIDIESTTSWALTRHAREGAARPVDLLFLHGMAAGSRVWTPGWLERFTGAGYGCWTMTLPGRAAGGTIASDPAAFDRALALAFETGDGNAAMDALAKALPGASLFDGPSLDDYSDALSAALASIGRPCVVVSHSLGGAVVQNMMRRGTRPEGTVLVCSAPPYGLWRASLEMAATNLPLWKALFDLSIFGVAATDTGVLRRNLFPSGIGAADFARLLAGFTDESLAATARTPGFPPFAPLPGPRRDMLVIGGEKDRFVPPLDVRLTGLYYGTTPRILRGAGHMPMYEKQSADEAARVIADWLDSVSFAN